MVDELWQYLVLVVVGAAVMALVAGAVASALVSLVLAFGRDASDADAGVAGWVGAWTLLWFSSDVADDLARQRSSREALVV